MSEDQCEGCEELHRSAAKTREPGAVGETYGAWMTCPVCGEEVAVLLGGRIGDG